MKEPKLHPEQGARQAKTMMFYPRRKIVAYLGMACLVAGVAAAFMAHERASIILSLGSIVVVLGSAILLGPVLRNQTIDVGDESFVVRTFGRAVELKATHLTEVVRHRDASMSYRFKSGNLCYQVSPLAYHSANILQQEFDRLFGLHRLEVTIAGPTAGRANNGVQSTAARGGES